MMTSSVKFLFCHVCFFWINFSCVSNTDNHLPMKETCRKQNHQSKPVFIYKAFAIAGTTKGQTLQEIPQKPSELLSQTKAQVTLQHRYTWKKLKTVLWPKTQNPPSNSALTWKLCNELFFKTKYNNDLQSSVNEKIHNVHKCLVQNKSTRVENWSFVISSKQNKPQSQIYGCYHQTDSRFFHSWVCLKTLELVKAFVYPSYKPYEKNLPPCVVLRLVNCLYK